MAFLLRVLSLLTLFFTHALTQSIVLGNRRILKGAFIDPVSAIIGGEGDNVTNGTNSMDNDHRSKKIKEKFNYDTVYKGGWELASENSGVLAMHMFIFPNTNKAIMFDALVFGPSQIQLPHGSYRHFLSGNKKNQVDSWAHAIEYDIDTAAIRPLKILTDTWCSSGGLSANGTLVHAGGWGEGGRSVRYLSGCSTCDWKEYPKALSGIRWYSTQQILPDGSFIVVGGRIMYSYEYVPIEGKSNKKNYQLPFLRETTDSSENNLYPFVFLSTDGNIFIFANNRSIILNPTTNKIVRELPILSGGSRNHPSSAMSTLLPVKLHDPNVIQAEVLICGGAKHDATILAEKGIFVNALQDCARIEITNQNATWHKETMPSPRVMGDMLLLPAGNILMINGAKRGTAGWNFAEDPNLTPVLYRPDHPKTQRFMELTPTTKPRMYHSTSTVLPDGKVLVAGSNSNYYYNFTGVKYPTKLRVEKFYPPYLDPLLTSDCPSIISNFKGKKLNYAQELVIQFKLKKDKVNQSDFKVTMYAPPFTTHGFSMGQRLLVLGISQLINVGPEVFQVTAATPPTATIAPPGYYLVFVVHRGVPSPGIWVQIA